MDYLFIYLFIIYSFLILPGCSFKCCHLFSHEAQGRNVPNSFDCKDGFSLLISVLTKFRIVEMANWLNLNKRPCWDLIRDPFASEANLRTAGLRYLFTIKRMLKIVTSPINQITRTEWTDKVAVAAGMPWLYAYNYSKIEYIVDVTFLIIFLFNLTSKSQWPIFLKVD